jgi:hypothetical protein
MQGTKSNLPDDVALQSEVFVDGPAGSQNLPDKTNLHSILKSRAPPSPPPAPIDPREPLPIAGPCKRCTKTGIPCQRRSDWWACIPCHVRRERCSLTLIVRAHDQASINRAMLDASESQPSSGKKRKAGKVQEDHASNNSAMLDASEGQRSSRKKRKSRKLQEEILKELRELNARQEETLRGMEEIAATQKHLEDVISNWMSAGEPFPHEGQ